MGARTVTIDPGGGGDAVVSSYSDGFKARMIQRMAGPEGISATLLAKEVGVSQNSLSRWLRKARSLGPMGKRQDEREGGRQGPQRWSVEEKLRVVVEAAGLSDEELGTFLRREGLHEAQLKEWREAAMGALMNQKRKSGERTPEARRIRELERELLRKEKALAEVAALLTLKKKAEEIWGAGDDDTTTRHGT
jgi:transposase-like protein